MICFLYLFHPRDVGTPLPHSSCAHAEACLVFFADIKLWIYPGVYFSLYVTNLVFVQITVFEFVHNFR